MEFRRFGAVRTRRSKIKELLGQSINTGHLITDQSEKLIAKRCILVVLREQLNERFDSDERVADFMRQTGAEQANGCELFRMLSLHREMRSLQSALYNRGEFEQLRDLRICEWSS